MRLEFWNRGVAFSRDRDWAMSGQRHCLHQLQSNRKRLEQGHQPQPEDRLLLAVIGGIGFAVTMFWFAWTGEYNNIHWFVPTLAGVFLTASMMLIFTTCLNYLTDTYTTYAASAVAANTVVRSAAGASAPLFTQRMFDILGIGGGGSLIGGVAVVLSVIPYVFFTSMAREFE
jgi:DHA1 family multidrug resistance protein-like MFS transporter